MTDSRCACGRPTADNALICSRKPASPADVGGCTERLARDLGDVGALAEELETTRLRQSRTGGQASGVLSRSYERPLPWDQRGSEAADVLRSTVVGWVRVVLDERGGPMPADTMRAMSGWLLAQIEWLRHSSECAEMPDELRHAVALAYRTVDSAPGRAYVGPCNPSGSFDEPECRTDLYARQGASEVRCPDCGLVWDVANRRKLMLEAAGDQLVSAADLSRFLSMYGEPLTAERIRQWASRGLLAAHGQTPDGRARYRVSEATDLLAKMAKGAAA